MSTPSSVTDTTGHLLVPGQHADVIQRLKNVPGYTTPVFKGKEEQRAKVQANVAAKVCLIISAPVRRVSRGPSRVDTAARGAHTASS